MKTVGPELTTLTHRLSECPPEFYQSPLESTKKGPTAVDIRAVISDHVRDLGDAPEQLAQEIAAITRLNPRCQRLVMISIWLLRDQWFMERGELVKPMLRLLSSGLVELANVVTPEKTVTDPDRREELARICLRELGLRPAGETLQQSTDRLTTLDSAERIRVIENTRSVEARAREIRKAMARKAAQEAAARYSPE